MELNAEEQIEEMAKVIDHTFEIAESIGASRPSSRMIAMDLYDAGCRKQSENERKEPTIDAVEVVRCEDCRHCISPDRGYPYCSMMSNPGEGEYYTPSGDHYCSYGERKQDNE